MKLKQGGLLYCKERRCQYYKEQEDTDSENIYHFGGISTGVNGKVDAN